MKGKMKYMFTGALIGAMVAGTTPALAANMTKNIQVAYQNIKLVVDGKRVSLSGNKEPFVYNGTTYLPIRAVGEAMDKQVSWDGNTKTVYIGDAGDMPGMTNYLVEVCSPYEVNQYEQPSTFKMGGKTYARGFMLGGTDFREGYALFNLNGKYNTLEFDLGHIDGDDMYDGAFDIYLDGRYSETIEIGAEDSVQHVSIPLNRASKLKIVTNYPDTYIWEVYYGFANAKLY